MRLRSVIPALKRTFASWDSHDAPRLGAAIAFYSILSLAPLMIFVVSICGLVFGSPVATDDILAQVRSTFGVEGAKEIEAILAQTHRPAAGIVASVIAFLPLLFGASGVFGELSSALNQIWDVARGTGSGIWNFFRQRIFSIGMVLAIGFLLLGLAGGQHRDGSRGKVRRASGAALPAGNARRRGIAGRHYASIRIDL